MAYKHFYIAVLLRLIIIIMLSIAGAFLYFEKQAFILCLVTLVLLIGAVINIIRYFNNINQWIALFLLGIENDDASMQLVLTL